ncbi:MAG: hypothetical protein J4N66_08350, partial [Chloroflexi bacterium]|nr:hypothetical protein [Chloroflexota bacterium]
QNRWQVVGRSGSMLRGYRMESSRFQRRLRIGYSHAARLMDELEDAGVVGAGEPGKPRPVL